jgi:hypothetical protein
MTVRTENIVPDRKGFPFPETEPQPISASKHVRLLEPGSLPVMEEQEL